MTDVVNRLTRSTAVDRFLSTGWEEVSETGCWEWSGSRHKRGYGQINDRGKMLKAHRVSYQHFTGPIPVGLLIRHTCDNPPCVNPEHLLLGTPGDNVRDAVSRGRARHQVMSGEKCPASKLNWEAVQQIRASDEPLQAVADRFGISKSAASKVRRHESWKEQGHVRTEAIEG